MNTWKSSHSMLELCILRQAEGRAEGRAEEYVHYMFTVVMTIAYLSQKVVRSKLASIPGRRRPTSYGPAITTGTALQSKGPVFQPQFLVDKIIVLAPPTKQKHPPPPLPPR